MQPSTRTRPRALSSRTYHNSGTRRQVVCRAAQRSDSGARHKGLADLGSALLPSHEVATWLVPALSAGIAYYAAAMAGSNGSLVILCPILASGVSTVAVALAKPPSPDWKAFASRTLTVKVQQKVAIDTYNTVEEFFSEELGVLLKNTNNESAKLLPYLMERSVYLSGHKPEEVQLQVVGPEGELISFWQGQKLQGVLRAINTIILRV